MMDSAQATSTRPYLIRALYEWCTDNGFTPYIAVLVNERVQVPREYVKAVSYTHLTLPTKRIV